MPDDRLDGMLRAFFRAEMPYPWPELKAPELPPQAVVVRPWWKRTGRFALAAAVVLLMIGYLALANNFPRPNGDGSGGLERVNGPIGDRQTHQPKQAGKNVIRMPVLIEEIKGRVGWQFKVYTEQAKEKR
jgi:hypothetical protein